MGLSSPGRRAEARHLSAARFRATGRSIYHLTSVFVERWIARLKRAMAEAEPRLVRSTFLIFRGRSNLIRPQIYLPTLQRNKRILMRDVL